MNEDWRKHIRNFDVTPGGGGGEGGRGQAQECVAEGSKIHFVQT